MDSLKEMAKENNVRYAVNINIGSQKYGQIYEVDSITVYDWSMGTLAKASSCDGEMFINTITEGSAAYQLTNVTDNKWSKGYSSTSIHYCLQEMMLY